MKALFLDIDGIMNSEDYAVYRIKSKKLDSDQFIDERAVVFLNYIIEETGAEVVLSSSWRGNANETQKRLEECGFKYKITSVTPYCASRIRGEEIKAWIDDYEKDHEPLESYAILDDDRDMLEEQIRHFVYCDNRHGLTTRECYKAIDILNTVHND